MKTYTTYIKLLRNVLPVAAIALLALGVSNCDRRDLWVYGDQFKQVMLNVDWRFYMRDTLLYPNQPDPDGMTVWFYPTDGRKSYQATTSEVRHYETYLSAGDYEAVVIDYSPQEYGHQEFIGMEWANTAKVQALPHSYQAPEGEVQLFGPNAYAGTPALPSTQPNTGLYTVSFEPEQMASDTVNMTISSGKYDDYIPYDEYEEYQRTLVKQEFNAKPLILPWRMRIRVYVRGIYYLHDTKASIAGLADGYMLALGHTSDQPCIQYLDDWEVHVTGDNVGYVAMTFNTWGLRNSMWPPSDYSPTIYYPMWPNYRPQDTQTSGKPSDIRLNFKFLLRDRKTVMYYHYDIGDMVQIHPREYALRVDLLDGFTCQPDNQPNLPYVEAYNGLGFDGWVVPWADGADADVNF